jgi:hypothetical protein
LFVLIGALLVVQLLPSAPSSRARTPFSWERAKGIDVVRAGQSLYNLKSAPLRELAARPAQPRFRTSLGKAHRVAGEAHGVSAAAIPAPSRGFDGIPNPAQGAPPDPTGEAGPNHYVQATNPGTFAIFTKNGDIALGSTPIAALWTGVGDRCETHGKGDPIVQYDQLAGRWLITQFAFDTAPDGRKLGPFLECVAVSRTADPLGEYFLYSFVLSDTVFPDFPKFGVWPDGYYMTVHLFDTLTGAFQQHGTVAFDRERMLLGRPAGFQIFGSATPDFFGALPADLDGTIPPPTGSPNFLISIDDFTNQLQIFKIVVDWMDRRNSGVLGPAVINVAPFDTDMCGGDRNCIPQPGTQQRLDALAKELVNYRAAYRNFGSHESLVFNSTIDFGSTDHAGIAWFELRNLQTTPVHHNGGYYAPDALHRWVASIAMDQSGNIGLGFSGSGPNAAPSIRYTGRLATDPPGVLPQGEIFFQGAGVQTGSNRWGDYTHMSVDPIDDCTFWYTNEYYSQTSGVGWRTHILSFKFPECDPRSPPVPDRARPRVAAQDRPDPFLLGERTRISWVQSEPATVDVGIFNAKGKLVAHLVVRNPLDAGNWFTRWNGRGPSGRPVAPGRYTYVIEARDQAGNVRRVSGRTTFAR